MNFILLFQNNCILLTKTFFEILLIAEQLESFACFQQQQK